MHPRAPNCFCWMDPSKPSHWLFILLFERSLDPSYLIARVLIRDTPQQHAGYRESIAVSPYLLETLMIIAQRTRLNHASVVFESNSYLVRWLCCSVMVGRLAMARGMQIAIPCASLPRNVPRSADRHGRKDHVV